MTNFLTSWKTSLCGMVGGILTILGHTAQLQTGTGKDWLVALSSAFFVTLTGLFAKDADKTGVK